MASLKLSHIYKVYDNGHKAVNDFSIDIEDKEFIVFVGPSGCGKSTTLRMIAGLEAITAGDLFIEDTLVNDMEPKDRNIAMVFQNYALYPHMTVYENMAFGLRNKHIDKEIIDQKVKEAAKILDITEYLDRKPKAMSGGQRQRVALGRAIVRDPKVFLLDEPLSNLDAKLRAQMRTEITKLHKKLGTTFIYVTHDQIEAMTMGTRIVVMKLGYVQQIDTPMNLYDKPHNAFVGGFIGTPQMNFFDVKLLRNKEKVFIEFVNGEKIVVPFEKVCKISESYLSGNKKVIFGIRPEHLSLSDDKKGIGCIVSTIERLGNETLIYGDLEDDNQEFTMADTGKRIVTKVFANPDIKVGEKIFLKVDFDHAHYFDGENEDAVTLVEDIPLYSEATLDIKKNKGRVFGNEVKLPEELLNRVNELNEVTLKIPPSSVVKGKDFSLKVLKIEKIGDKNLAYLDNNGHILFALVDSSVKEKSMYSFSLLLDEVDFLNGNESVLTKLDKNVKFVGKFVKKEIKENRERIYHFFANIKNANFEIKQSDGFKMNAIEGNKCYNKSYRYEIDRDEITLLNELDMPVIEENKKKKNYEAFGIEATFVREIRYGYKKYNEVCIGENENIIINDFGLKEGDVVHLTFNGEKASIFSIDNDIKII